MEPYYHTFEMVDNGYDELLIGESYREPYSYRMSDRSNNLFFNNDSYFLSLSFVGDGTVPENYDLSGDISINQDGKVMLYLVSHPYIRHNYNL